ncbi:AgmX/PglI C-terminal domain-containing protein [Microbulbifer rhizosphaerae]|uniref:Outer membrane biosynthesis protein TonB n=1 Tax=Microbulbifer rhizosphaerae TaxID=1562603 RepID=A0A7W4Z8A8_9GAMM|nr:AgmX/PglI C-terminal domain-containing protein [Microbulbifer rhizosphaerae]MBB3060583.1 outer membrane biosynthesis protein TonB [Microbulbifer rhizosphaerae]
MASAINPQFAPWLFQETVLPWSASEEEDKRFVRFLKHGLIAFLLLGIVVALIPVPELTREQAERIPPQLAKVILEKKTLPKPEPKPKPKPVEKKAPEPKKPEPKPEPKIQEKPPAAKVELARKKAANSGLLQMQDDLLAMRESVDIAEVSSGQLAAGAATSAKTVGRSLISDRSKTASGGVNTGKLSRDTGGRALAARETTVVENTQASGAAREAGQKARREKSARAEESIRSVMEANKSAIYAIYNRALRRDPTLQGKVTVQLVIESNGTVSAIKVVSSELNSPDLERKLLARIRLINFGAANVDRATLNYSIDFLPS